VGRKKQPKITAAEINRLLDQQHPNVEKSMIAFEVGDATGGNQRRWADAVSMEFWPSRGLEIVGYEVKISRSDWLNELKDPSKSQAVSRYCDRFYLVAPPGVLGIDELPKTWGYIEVTAHEYGDQVTWGLRTKNKAPKRDVTPINRNFAASLIRCALRKYGNKEMLQTIRQEEENKARALYKNHNQKELAIAQRRLSDLQDKVRDFERISGVSINSFRYHRAGEAIAWLNNNRHRKELAEQLQMRIQQQKNMIDADQKMLDNITNWPEGGKDEQKANQEPSE